MELWWPYLLNVQQLLGAAAFSFSRLKQRKLRRQVSLKLFILCNEILQRRFRNLLFSVAHFQKTPLSLCLKKAKFADIATLFIIFSTLAPSSNSMISAESCGTCRTSDRHLLRDVKRWNFKSRRTKCLQRFGRQSECVMRSYRASESAFFSTYLHARTSNMINIAPIVSTVSVEKKYEVLQKEYRDG